MSAPIPPASVLICGSTMGCSTNAVIIASTALPPFRRTSSIVRVTSGCDDDTMAFATALAEAAEYIAERGVARKAAPALVRFITQVAARFGIPVSEKVMAQSVPVVGAAGGALINVLFIDHFRDVARGHFIIRRLERVHGSQTKAAQRDAWTSQRIRFNSASDARYPHATVYFVATAFSKYSRARA